jgi:hypothetical protein
MEQVLEYAEAARELEPGIQPMDQIRKLQETLDQILAKGAATIEAIKGEHLPGNCNLNPAHPQISMPGRVSMVPGLTFPRACERDMAKERSEPIPTSVNIIVV